MLEGEGMRKRELYPDRKLIPGENIIRKNLLGKRTPHVPTEEVCAAAVQI